MLGLGEIPMRLRTTVTLAGAVTFLKVSSKPFRHAPSSGTGETLDSAYWIRQWRRYGVVSFLEALSGLLEESQDGN